MKTALMLIFMNSTAHAHEGHGLWGTHWHASDTWGFLVLAVVLAFWFSRK